MSDEKIELLTLSDLCPELAEWEPDASNPWQTSMWEAFETIIQTKNATIDRQQKAAHELDAEIVSLNDDISNYYHTAEWLSETIKKHEERIENLKTMNLEQAHTNATNVDIIVALRAWLADVEHVDMDGPSLNCPMCGWAKTIGHDPQCLWAKDKELLGRVT